MKKYLQTSGRTRKLSNLSTEERRLAFQHWAAYELYSGGEEAIGTQLKCPLIGCSINFDNLRSCLSHLAGCAWLSNSWYWCPFCERGEHFAEPGPVLSSWPKPEPSLEVFDSPRCLAPGKTNFNNTTAQLLRHLASKLGLLPRSQMLRLPISMGLGEENDQDITNHGFDSVWEQSTASVSELEVPMKQDTKPVQHPGIESVEFAWMFKRADFCPPELEAPHGQPSEPSPAELSGDFDHPLELIGSTTFNPNAEYRCSSSKTFSNDKHPGPTDPTYLSELPEQPPPYQASAKEETQLETPAWRSWTAPSRSSFPQYGYSTDRLPIDDSTMYHFGQAPFFSSNGPLSPPVHPYTGRHYDPTMTKRNCVCVSLQPGQRPIDWPLGSFPQTPTSNNRNRLIGQETPHGGLQEHSYNNHANNQAMITPYAFREPNLSSPSPALPRSDPMLGPYNARKRTWDSVPLSFEDAHHTTDNQEQLWPISPLGSLENHSITSSWTVLQLPSDGAQEARVGEAWLSPLVPVAAPSPSKPLPSSNRCSGELSQKNPSTQPTSTEVSPVSAEFTATSTEVSPVSAEFTATSTEVSPVSADPTAATTTQSRTAKGVSKCHHCEAPFKGTFQDRKGNLKRHIKTCHGDQKYKCSICTTECSRSDNLLKHRRTKHGDGLPLRRSNAHKVRRSL